MLNCRQASELMSRAREENLPLRARMSLRMHVMFCHCCSALEDNLQLLARAVHRQAEKPLDEARRKALEDTVRKARQNRDKDETNAHHSD